MSARDLTLIFARWKTPHSPWEKCRAASNTRKVGDGIHTLAFLPATATRCLMPFVKAPFSVGSVGIHFLTGCQRTPEPARMAFCPRFRGKFFGFVSQKCYFCRNHVVPAPD